MCRSHLLLAALLLAVALFASAQAYDVVVQTSHGHIGGAKTALGFQFRSVPFAAPPLGDLRFAPPQVVESWEGVLNATGLPYACPQPRTDNGPTNEDCLYMSIYVPLSFEHNKKAKRDVAVFWHGGAFRGGGQINFIGDYLANNTNTVVVVPQYRLGALGLLGHEVFQEESGTYGNYNLMDQRMALLWVQSNIRAFGGNPNSVTITGQSAGAISVAIHSVSPMTWGLYHRAISHSGTGYSGNYLSDKSWITNTMWKLIDGLGCSNATCNKNATTLSPECSEAIRRCLRAAPYSTIVTVQSALPEFVKPRPAVDGIVIPAQPIELVRSGDYNRVPTLFGFMNNESTALIQKNYPAASNKTHFDQYVTSMFGAGAIPTLEQLYPVVGPGATYPTYYSAMAKIDTDWFYTCPTLEWLNAMASTGHKRAYLYRWTYEANWFPAQYGAHHNEDIVYLNQQGCVLNAPAPGYCNLFTQATTPQEMPLVTKLQGFWASFVAKGKPGIDHWKAYTSKQSRPHLRIASPTAFEIEKDVAIQPQQCAFLNSMA